jgi:hypothetical protein
MKRILFLMMCMLVVTSQKSTAQDSSTTQLIKLPKVNHVGFYIAPELQFGQLRYGFTGFGGNSFMLLINKKLGVGITSFRNLDRNYSPSSLSPLLLNANYHGLKFEYTVNGNKAIHLTFPLTIGVANASADTAGALYGRNRPHMDGNDASPVGFNNTNRSRFMFVQPGVQVEANVFKCMKVYAGVNYRVAWKDAMPNQLSNSTVEGLSANAGIKFGLFEVPTHKKKK